MDEIVAGTSRLSLTPLGAGDLIDRAIRFYRNNFWTFIWIAAPPVLAGTVISVTWTVLSRSLFNVDMVNNPGETAFYYIFLWLGNLLIWLVEGVATLTVMGGASRNFVRHLLFGEPVTFRQTYGNMKTRFWGLVVSSTIIVTTLGILGFFIFYLGLLIGFVAVAVAVYAFAFSPFLATMIAIAIALGVTFLTLWLFFLLASRFAYVPQVILVEGTGVFESVARSASLASGNVKRLAGLVIFTLLTIYSALALLYVPLGWYAWINGIELWRFTFDPDATPAWYEISNQLIWQVSLILLVPVWMIGLCLLYVDERVRHEGYDIELMAARRLGEIPEVSKEFLNPLQPALGTIAARQPQEKETAAESSGLTTLGLK